MQKSYQANAPRQRQFTDNKKQKNKGERITNAIANAGLRVRLNIWNLYIHLCWQTAEQQFTPALAITCPGFRERQPLPPSVEQNLTEKNRKVNHSSDNG